MMVSQLSISGFFFFFLLKADISSVSFYQLLRGHCLVDLMTYFRRIKRVHKNNVTNESPSIFFSTR